MNEHMASKRRADASRTFRQLLDTRNIPIPRNDLDGELRAQCSHWHTQLLLTPVLGNWPGLKSQLSRTPLAFLSTAELRRVRSCHSEVCAPILLPAGLIALGTKRPLFSVAEGLNPV
jgi:hypothetical protein